MSGGAFNYACRRVEDFAEELRAKIANNGKENDYGEKCEFSPETIALLQAIVEDAERTAKLMKAAEWLCSGHTGDDDLVKVTPLHDGMFLVDVLCDYYFRAYLTKAQILALAEELRAMACGHDFADAIRERKHK